MIARVTRTRRQRGNRLTALRGGALTWIKGFAAPVISLATQASLCPFFRQIASSQPGVTTVSASPLRLRLCAAVVCLASSTAQGFIDPPMLTTPNPTAGQLVFISLRAGGCDFIMNHDVPQVTVSGSTIRVLLWNAANTPPFCLFEPLVFPIPVGRFPAGQYRLQIDSYWHGSSGLVFEPIGTLALTVRGAAPVPAPALGGGAGFLLGLSLAIVGLFGLRRSANQAV